MSQLNTSSQDKSKQRQLAIRRAQFLKKIKITVKSAQKILDDDHLIIIQTFNTQKNKCLQLVMRKLSQLDNLIAHIKIQYGGHVIPLFNHDLYFQKSLQMQKLIPDIQEYLNDLKHNKYCRQDVKFYCFMIQQNTTFPKQMGFQRMITNATDKSRKFLNQLFTRRQIHSLKDTTILVISKQQLDIIISNYTQVKQLTLGKVKQIIIFEEISQLFAEMCSQPSIAVQPQEFDSEFIFKTVKNCQKLINQAKQAFARWQLLVDNVRQLQNNVYKGLHQFQAQFNLQNQQLKTWSQSLSSQFDELSEYLSQKTQALSGSLYILNKKFIDMTVFAGQYIKIEEKQQQILNSPKLNEKFSFQINQQIKINGQLKKLDLKSTSQKMEQYNKIQLNKQQITSEDD